MNQDGRMARLNDLIGFSKKHKLKIASIEDLISFRLNNEKLVKHINTKKIIFKKQKCEFITYKSKLDNGLNFVVKKGNYKHNKTIKVRVISKKFKKDKINLNDKEIQKSLNILYKNNNFALIIVKDLKTQKQKIFDEYKSNILRYYGIGAQIIKDLGIKKMILLSRTKKKIIALDGYGIKVIKQQIIK